MATDKKKMEEELKQKCVELESLREQHEKLKNQSPVVAVQSVPSSAIVSKQSDESEADDNSFVHIRKEKTSPNVVNN